MSDKIFSYWMMSCMWVFLVALGFHYGSLKTPVEGRSVASSKAVDPWYNCQFKM